jgi:hypothetical protein
MNNDEASYNSSSDEDDDIAFDDAYDVSLEIANEAEEDDIFNEESIGAWNPVNKYVTRVVVDGVDHVLLAKAREEVPEVLHKIKRHLLPDENMSLAHASLSDMLSLWLNAHLLDCFVNFVNKNLSPKATSNEIKAFIQVELMLAFYRCSPGRYYNQQFRNCYQMYSDLDYERYTSILKALCKSDNHRIKSEESWVPVFNHDNEVSNAMDILRRNCAQIAYVPEVSYVALDDDLLRLRSKKVYLEFGPGTFSLVTHSKKDTNIVSSNRNEYLEAFENSIIQLTAGQRSPEWFLLRKFRVTGTGAFSLWRRSAILFRRRAIKNLSIATCRVLSLLSIQHTNNDVDGDDPDKTYSNEELSTQSQKQLAAICRTKNIPRTGNNNISLN